MDLTTYDNPTEYYGILNRQGFLTYPDNELLLGVLQSIISDPAGSQTTPFLATVHQQESVVLAALMTPPWPIVIAADSATPEAFRPLTKHLKHNGISVSGVNAPQPIANRFVAEWCRHTSCTPTVKMDMRLYRLTNVQPVPPCPGRLVPVDGKYRDLALAWAYEFQRDVRIDDSTASIEPHVDAVIHSRNAFLWVDQQPVCMTFRERPHAAGVSIGYVYTPPQHRKKGYATNLVAEVSRNALHEGFRYCALFADTKNPTTNHIYQEIGYRPVSDYSYYTF